ncbi:hypothetical protein EV182_003131 [Spiromyces aspiralis]|uniref:Uncharacterized protein n=1 Tax=Spiromyces aspiralis TaxID=68401 RepID=A0ACC1HDV5_9FUNG|nr:hypothetical protein EV182_003131 [Spiromyces aspiralis]
MHPKENSKTATPTPTNSEGKTAAEHYEKILTIPNMLTAARILASPYIGYLIVQHEYKWALAGCALFGITDALDGYIARKYNMGTFIGSIIDPAADKILMTVLTVSLTVGSLLPVPLAVLIVGRDVALSLAAFYIRWITLPAPKTFARYWDLSLPSVEVRPTAISKWNTALQLLLMGTTLTVPAFGLSLDHWAITALQWLTGATTVASGIGYLTSKNAVHMLTKKEIKVRLKKPVKIYKERHVKKHRDQG